MQWPIFFLIELGEEKNKAGVASTSLGAWLQKAQAEIPAAGSFVSRATSSAIRGPDNQDSSAKHLHN